jgi:hypothetical protein
MPGSRSNAASFFCAALSSSLSSTSNSKVTMYVRIAPKKLFALLTSLNWASVISPTLRSWELARLDDVFPLEVDAPQTARVCKAERKKRRKTIIFIAVMATALYKLWVNWCKGPRLSHFVECPTSSFDAISPVRVVDTSRSLDGSIPVVNIYR